VTTLHVGMQVLVAWGFKPTISRMRVSRPDGDKRWMCAEEKPGLTSTQLIDEADEGLTWLPGWDVETEGALRAAYALVDR
jgi:hypothetical protein